ncbi:MAG: flagellar basal body P-ring formation protein FlgA [Acetobacteraceae bacterium]|nr:flagellar basal body P-ring formation protein FlgA [Acetobacteraceae bacterium]
MRPFLWTLPILSLSLSAEAATLRSFTLLHGPDVHLSDLFDDAGANADRRLGPAPGPGGRIVVEAAQLGGIARQFEVDWRPASSGDRAVLERPGRPLRREDVLAAVKAALLSAGASEDCDIELPGFSPPLVPVEAEPHSVVTQLDYDSASGRFGALLSVAGDGMEPINVRIAGHADDTIELPVTNGRFSAGTVLRPDDVHMARVRTSVVRGEVAHAVADAVGMQVRHQVQAGQPLLLAELTRPPAVQRGAAVQMQIETGGLSVTGQGIAMESGANDERIRVLNPVSHAVIEAVVIGPGRVRVVPDSTPLQAPARVSQVFVQ